MTSALEHFRAGGWAMWFILVFGAMSILAAGRFAHRGVEGFERFGRWMIGTTLLASAFGFVVGLIATLEYVLRHAKNNEERFSIVLEGTGESLNNVASGLLLATLASLLIAVGHRRFMQLGR
jgi:hypothetical protein